MATDVDSLEKRYVDCCLELRMEPNESVLSSFLKAKVKKARHETTNLVVLLDHLKDADYLPLLHLFTEIDISDIEAVDVINTSSCDMSWENVLMLLRAISEKLRVVHLQDAFFKKSLLLDIAEQGLTCRILHLRSSQIHKLNLEGRFLQLNALNLDFSVSLTNFQETCFSCMPNLTFLSLCETRISNLWTASAALARLPSLAELRFQNCARWDVSWCFSLSSQREPRDSIVSGDRYCKLYKETSASTDEESLTLNPNGELDFGNYHRNICQTNFQKSSVESSSDGCGTDFSILKEGLSSLEYLPDLHSHCNVFLDLQNQNSLGMEIEEEEKYFPGARLSESMEHTSRKMPIGDHPSPICYEKYYREYMISSLRNLKVLDNLPIGKIERDKADILLTQQFEYLPYKRKHKENVVSILSKREIQAIHSYVGTSKQKKYCRLGNSQYSYSRSLVASRMGSSAWPSFRPVFRLGWESRDERRSFRPRQFEYHPSDSSLMVFGTLDGEVVVVNHESENVVGYVHSLGAMSSVLGLCWLKKYPLKLIAGSDNGSLRLYDLNHMPRGTAGFYSGGPSAVFDDFEQLTSVHVNSTDELFLASGYSKHVALYDINSGRCLQLFTDMHREHINVVKFSNHSPSVFATSSFDHDVKLWDLRQKPSQPCYTATSSRGNVMVCFSPDDKYLLVSAVDNEVKQLLAVDGRLHLDFGIMSTGSTQNYTRSYYMNGKDYVISGSCDEHVVRICCAQTGRRLRDITLEGKGTGASMFVQSLRGDPFRDFNLSVLAAYIHPSSNPEIVKVNLLTSSEQEKQCSFGRSGGSSLGFGG